MFCSAPPAMARVAVRCIVAATMCAACAIDPGSSPESTEHSGAAVIGGTPINRNTYPATGALVGLLQSGPLLICSGTLIGKRSVLTAAHCLSGTRSYPLAFTLTADVRDVSETYAVRGTHIHPDFDANAVGPMHDVAIAELSDDIVDAVPERAFDATDPKAGRLGVDAQVQLVGYGSVLDAAGVVGIKNAGTSTIASLSTYEIIVGLAGGVQNCVGDSGGPSFIAADDGGRRLVGVVSRSVSTSSPCSLGAIHTRVDAHWPWISLVTSQISADSTGQVYGCSVRPTVRSKARVCGACLALVILFRGMRRKRRLP
jgi:secreted trypsin-like serine protease